MAIAFTPDARLAYATDQYPSAVIPIRVATGTVLPSIKIGHGVAPMNLAVTPDGRTAYVTDAVIGDGLVTPIDTATGTVLRPISAGTSPLTIASPRTAGPPT